MDIRFLDLKLVTDGYIPVCGCWESNSSPLGKQKQIIVLLVTEPSLHLPSPAFLHAFKCSGRFDCIHTLVSAGSNRTEFCLTAAFNPFFVSESPRRNVLLNCDRFVYKDGDSYIFVDSSYRKHRFEMLSPSLYYDTAHTGLTLSAPTKAMYPRLFRAAI